jgi:hypothetical protein
MAADPSEWFVRFNFPHDNRPALVGKPWGTGTEMAARAQTPGAVEWDVGCKVTALIGGYRAMCEMRDALEQVITDATTGANKALPAGQRGHVYIADWRFNCLCDLSDSNAWGTSSWASLKQPYKPLAKPLDQTAIGLVLRLMQAGVIVRILVWLPVWTQSMAADLGPHIADHNYLRDIVSAENDRLMRTLNPAPSVPIGIVGLDA